VMYGSGGESRLEDEGADPSSGYDQAAPVRIGNGAYDQEQHDVWGAVPGIDLSPYEPEISSPDRCGPIISAGREALERWRDTDRGIWECAERQELHLLEAECGSPPTVARALLVSRQDEGRDQMGGGCAESHDDIWSTRSTSAVCSSRLRDQSAGCVSVLMPMDALSSRTDRRIVDKFARSPNRADRRGRSCSATAWRRPTRSLRRGGDVHDCLTSGWSRRCARSVISDERAGRCEKLL